VTGKRRASGNWSTSLCWIGWRATGRLIGRGPSWTAVRSGQFLGAADGTESYRPGQAGQQAPS